MAHAAIIPKTVEKRLKRAYNVTAKKTIKKRRENGANWPFLWNDQQKVRIKYDIIIDEKCT